MEVQAQWFKTSYGVGKYEPDGEPLTLSARETPKLLFVTLPSGHVERVKKFTSMGRVRTREVLRMSSGGKIVISWNPEHFEKTK